MLFRWQRGFSWRQLRKSRAKAPLVLCLIFLLILFSYLSNRSQAHEPWPQDNISSRPLSPFVKEQAKFWRALYTIILNNDPQCEQEKLEVIVPHKLDVMFDPAHNHIRPDLLWIRPSDITKMKKAHSNFLNDLKTPPQLFYQLGTQGIVMSAGIKHLPVLTISLRMLRRTGCTLPVEIFLAADVDYDQHICENVFPDLNARCMVFVDITRAADTGVILERFQYKIMALLFSSFEDVLLLDSDAFPVSDPASLFNTGPFDSMGMIVWPDFWYASESPYFFEIANLGKPPALNSRPSMESGELMFSKSRHNLTLMLAAYYNYYGPGYYYPLQSQGAPGQGDKETFAWAAAALKVPFYSVHEPVIALGHVDSKGAFFGSAMAQHDPVQDFHRISTAAANDQRYGAPQQRPQSASVFKGMKSSSTTPLFIHANFPKFDPSTIFQYTTQAKGAVGPCFDSNNTAVRSWMPKAQMKNLFGFDVERAFWAEIEYVACKLESEFKAWEGKKDICFGVQEYIKAVFPV